MKNKDLFLLVLHNLRRMRTRVIMTALGVVIGTASVMVLVSLGAGLARQTRESLMSGGGLTDLQVIAPIEYQVRQERPPGAALESEASARRRERQLRESVVGLRALDDIRALPGVEAVFVFENLMAQAMVSYEHREGYPTLLGVEPQDLEAMGVQLEDGTFEMRRGQVIVGARVASSSLRDPATVNPYREAAPSEPAPPPDLLGETLRLRVARVTEAGTTLEKTVRLEVVGVLASSGWRHDYAIYLPMRDMLDLNTWSQGRRRDPDRQGYPQIIVRAVDVQHTLEVEQALQEMGLSAFSEQQQVEQAEAYFATVQAVLGGIGGVALLVAAFGIANTMLMAIYERTREIGLMKAIGATHRDVMLVFLAEAGGIGLLGGVGGMVLGLLVNGLINLIAGAVRAEQVAAGASPGPTLGIAYAPLWLPPFAVVFALLVGVASGAYPANRAANLQPLHALKYE
jgi:putative ABC transport system permease protein